MAYNVREHAVLTENLGRRFGETEALAGLDLAVAPGTVLGLLGHNGAGKTTAVRILTTLLAPSAGRAFVGGFDVVREAGAVRAQIAVAGQDASLDDRLTGRENLMLLGRLQKLSKPSAVARTSELLERFGIAHAADRQVGTYSGGMRRRLDLAACLVVHRPVVFLDEPTTGLDPVSRAEMWGAIEGLVKDGTALLLTTQYLEEADRLADEIVVLSGGRTVAAGTPAQLKARVGDRRVHVSLPDDGALASAARLFGDVELDPRARRLSLPAPDGPRDLRVVLDALEDAGLDVAEASLSQPTLDDAFFALAGEPIG
ncbi:MAG TPA: ATP-binding cassette domain-containing protein [Solirubrobacter sp.]|nr:ATP-binding cassette domain-containing protein [Solirubrobacter sp.]